MRSGPGSRRAFATAVFTASWTVALTEPKAVAVRISVGCPAAAKDAPFIGALAPFGLFGKDLPPDEFAAGYHERLDRYGVQGIRARIERVARAHPDRPLLLCCFEKDPADCHRGLLSRWWKEQTGGAIPEWEPTPEPDPQMTLIDDPKEKA